MLVQARQDFLDELQLLLSHRLDNETPIMTEEEKASAGSCSLTRLEYLVNVFARIQRLLDLVEVDVIHGPHTLEDTRRESCDLGARQVVSAVFLRASRSLKAVEAGGRLEVEVSKGT